MAVVFVIFEITVYYNEISETRKLQGPKRFHMI